MTIQEISLQPAEFSPASSDIGGANMLHGIPSAELPTTDVVTPAIIDYGDELVGFGPLVDSDHPVARIALKALNTSFERDVAFAERDYATAERDVAQQQIGDIETKARFDDLTEMLNRAAFEAKIQEWMDTGRPFGLLFTDLTNFKLVNDAIDHKTGDDHLVNTRNVLRFVIEETLRLKKNRPQAQDVEDIARYLGESDYEDGRLGGDEMGAIVDLSGRSDRENNMTPLTRMKRIKQRLLTVFDGYVEFNDWRDSKGQELDFDIRKRLGISVGYVVYNPKTHTTPRKLIHYGDLSMKRHKSQQHKEKGGAHRPIET